VRKAQPRRVHGPTRQFGNQRLNDGRPQFGQLMWKPTNRWKPARTSGSSPIPVESTGSITAIGLAKQRGMLNEKLASDFAALISVNVPKVELDTVEGRTGLHSISHAHGNESIDVTLLRERLGQDFNSPTVQDALKRASGLVVLYAWIATGDLKDDHLVLARDAAGQYHVAGIDFEASFQWSEADGGQVQRPHIPPSMVVDKTKVGEAVSAVEALTDEQIRDTINGLPESIASNDEKQRIASGLIGRRSKLRDCMKAQQWLD
jgi:hypothetical protein